MNPTEFLIYNICQFYRPIYTIFWNYNKALHEWYSGRNWKKNSQIQRENAQYFYIKEIFYATIILKRKLEIGYKLLNNPISYILKGFIMQLLFNIHNTYGN